MVYGSDWPKVDVQAVNPSLPPDRGSSGLCAAFASPLVCLSRASGPRSLLGDSGLAHAFKYGLEPSQICWVVAHSFPKGVGAGDGEGAVERGAGLDCGMRLVQSIEVRRAAANMKYGVG
jgi:hypothetical protein